MPYERPSLGELKSRVENDFEINSDVDAKQIGTFENANAQTLAAGFHVLYGKLDFFAKQLFDDTAEDEFLLRRASGFGITLIPASESVGFFSATGSDGGAILSGLLLRAGDGREYLIDSPGVIAGGVATVPITAVDAGIEGNKLAGDTLTFVQPPANVDSQGVVGVEGLTGGANTETFDRLRARFKERKQTPPLGGGTPDYIAWCKQANVDVTRVFVTGHKNESGVTEFGSVLIHPVADELASPVQSVAVRAQIQSYIDGMSVRPVGAKNIYVGALNLLALNMQFTSLTSNTPEVQAEIDLEVADLIMREAKPGGVLLLSHLREAISSAAGENDFELASPTTDVPVSAIQLLVLGSTQWPGA